MERQERERKERQREVQEREQRERVARIRDYRPPARPRRGRADPADAYRRRAQEILKRYGDKTDLVRADGEIAKAMLGEGYHPKEVCMSIAKYSPALSTRDPETQKHYGMKVVAKVAVLMEEAVGRKLWDERGNPLKPPQEKTVKRERDDEDRGPSMR